MSSTERRILLVAVVVCGFAVGMAGLLNYFKYRSTANGVVAERLTVTGKSVETSIQSSLALGLHFSDIGTLPGTLERERATDNLIQGIDVAGIVVEVGDVDDDAWVGRRVVVDPAAEYHNGAPSRIIGSEVNGGFAQFFAGSVSQLHDVTGSPLSDAQLACLPTAYGTALGMLNRATCVEGERVLVTGASGGVGMAAVQLALARGCVVIARTSEPKAALLRDVGASEVSVRGVDDLTDTAEVDAVVDVVGGEEFGRVFDRLRDAGRLVTAGAIAGPVVELDLRRLYLRWRTLIGSTMHTRSDFVELATIARAGSLSPLVAEVFPLRRIAAAQERFVAKDFVGKLVLDPWDVEVP